MNIVLCSHTGVYRGGAEKSLVMLARYLIANGESVTVTIPDSHRELSVVLDAEGISYIRIVKDDEKNPVGFLDIWRKLQRRLTYIRRFICWLKKHDADLVYLNTIRTLSELVSCKLVGIKTINHVRGFDSKFPLRYFLCLFADRIIVLNEYSRRFLSNRLLGWGRIVVIPNGVVVSECASGKLRSDKKVCRILYVGGYEKRKRSSMFLRLAQQLSSECVEFHHVGDPHPKDELTEKALRKYAGSIIEHGVISDVPSFIQSRGFDFFVLLSESEGMPRSLLEAMERGLVPIVSQIPEHTDIVTPEFGFLFNCDRFESEAVRLKAFIQNADVKLKSKMVREIVVRNYDIKDVNQRILQLMRKSYRFKI